MERLTAKNFLGIGQADLEVAKFTVIIGPQASGKSVLAKLIHFFRRSFVSSVLELALGSRGQVWVDGYWSEQFCSYFSPLSWGDGSFELNYAVGNFSARIRRNSGAKDIEVEFDGLDGAVEEVTSRIDDGARARQVHFALGGKYDQADSLFIPAGRSFLSILQQNAFKIFRENPRLDPTMWEFGAKFETYRQFYALDALESESDPHSVQLQVLFNLVLKGNYRRDNEQDWIDVGGRSVILSDASSGQQSVLPLLLALSSRDTRLRKLSVIIEEPEAHLFPDSQRNIIRLLSLLQRRYETRFLVTTHSPYILTALNNLIIAGDVLERLGESNAVDPDFQLRYEEVRAYTIQDGQLVSILDEESRLIGVNVIDGVSEVLSEEFDRLLRLKYSEVSA
ncbi:MAG: ATP-binding protein [Candidatus Hydrogenedentes bacterium]|nr:ATP-binding protein [Candidatus Hydrogenedentota bacterium]